MRRLLFVLAALALALASAAPIPAMGRCTPEVRTQGDPQGGAAERARRLLQRQDVQTELPGERAGKAPGAGDSGPSRVPPSSSGGEPGRGWRSQLAGGSGIAIATPLMWGVVALAVLALLVAILRGIGDRSPAFAEPRARVRAEAVPNAIAGGEDRRPDYVALADEGQFGAALHAMLREALGLLQARAGRLPVHATARAAVRHGRRHSLAVESLDGLVGEVERVHFGGAAADAERYRHALLALEQWRSVCRPKT